jgi:hypothetical protein
MTYSSWAIDWTGLYQELRKTIRAAAPPLDYLINQRIMATTTEAEILEVLNSLGQEIAYFTSAQPGKPDLPRTTVLMAVKDRERLGKWIDSLIAAPQIKTHIRTTEFLGYEIRALRPQMSRDELPPGGGVPDMGQLVWVLTDDFLVVGGTADPIKEVVQLKAGKSRESLAGTKEYREARALLPRKIDAFEYSEVGALVEMILRQWEGIAKEPALQATLGGLFDFSISLPPATARRYFGLAASGALIDDEGISMQMVFAAPKK